jgi:hypothetical protein
MMFWKGDRHVERRKTRMAKMERWLVRQLADAKGGGNNTYLGSDEKQLND